MNPNALALVLASALIHAAWNGLIKREQRSLAFLWLVVAWSVCWLALATFFRGASLALARAAWVWVSASGLLHCLYYVLLGKGYERGELSTVYPIARGVGPALVAVAGVLLLGERVTAWGVMGIGLVISGVCALGRVGDTGQEAGSAGLSRAGAAYGVAIGAAIAGYSLVDKRGVAQVAPEPFMLLSHALAVVVLTPVVLRPLREAYSPQAFRGALGLSAAAGALMVLGYQFVLYALRMANASYVVPARSASILFAVLFGGRLLGERNLAAKLLASCAIFGGIWLIAARG